MANHRHSNTQARLGNRRILVVLNGIVEAEAFRRATGLGRRDEQHAEVRVIAPALNSRIRHWLSDEDEARRRAHLRLAASRVSALRGSRRTAVSVTPIHCRRSTTHSSSSTPKRS